MEFESDLPAVWTPLFACHSAGSMLRCVITTYQLRCIWILHHPMCAPISYWTDRSLSSCDSVPDAKWHGVPECSQLCRRARLLLWYVPRIIARNYDEMDVLPASVDRELTEENKLLHTAVAAEETIEGEREKRHLVCHVADYRCETDWHRRAGGVGGCSSTLSRFVVSRCPLRLLQPFEPFSASDHKSLSKHTSKEMHRIQAKQVLRAFLILWAPIAITPHSAGDNCWEHKHRQHPWSHFRHCELQIGWWNCLFWGESPNHRHLAKPWFIPFRLMVRRIEHCPSRPLLLIAWINMRHLFLFLFVFMHALCDHFLWSIVSLFIASRICIFETFFTGARAQECILTCECGESKGVRESRSCSWVKNFKCRWPRRSFTLSTGWVLRYFSLHSELSPLKY